MDKIFVQIASYRDPELCKTIDHCILRAEFPDRLRFGIVNQYNPNDSFHLDIEKYKEDSRFTILNVPFDQSLGACWARSETNKMYGGEEFMLQIDSHSRFVEKWDSKLINSWKELNDEMAIYTSYPPSFDPLQNEKDWGKKPYIIHVYAIKNNLTKQRPKTMEDWQNRKAPYKARHVAAGFIFAKGSLIKEVPYDPDLYFSGEETSLMIRFFTHGYNVYHPNNFFLWHYYTRSGSSKHWNDQKTAHLTAKSLSRLKCLLGLNADHDLKNFGLGSQRSLLDYKKYSGIDFERSILHKDVVEAKEPPVDDNQESWSLMIKNITKNFKWDNSLISHEDDVSFWAFFVKDSSENTIKRINLTKDNYPDIINRSKSEVNLDISYYYPAQEPKSFVIWPYSKSKKWLRKSPLFYLDKNNIEIKNNINMVIPLKDPFKKNKVLILGSGRSGFDIKKYENEFDFIVVVNNSWSLTNKWTYWVHPNDYKGTKPEIIAPNQVEINANGYGKSLRKHGGIHECGFSIMLNASYWVLDNLNPYEICYLGADMNYSPDENGNTHFYGIGLDIKSKGISDPDLMVQRRSNGDPEYLKNIYNRFQKIANEHGCLLYNLSKEENTRLPYLKK